MAPRSTEHRVVSRAKPQSKRMSTQPIVAPPTKAALEAQGRADGGSTTSSAHSPSSSGVRPVVSTILTVTIDGSLKGPPEFDIGAFKTNLAQRLDMHSGQFKVKRLTSRRRAHEIQTSENVFITVDVDEDGYLSHEATSSESASSSGSESPELDYETVDGGITFAIASALKPHGRITSESIAVLWTKEGSIILCLELAMPHAFALLDLHARGHVGQLKITSVVPGEPTFGRNRLCRWPLTVRKSYF